MSLSRRAFLKFLGISSLALASCNKKELNKLNLKLSTAQAGLKASFKDKLLLAEGLDYHIIRSWKDPINDKELFGTNNDFTCFFGIDDNNALLWVNHETLDPELIPSIEEQRKSVGGSVIALQKINNKWLFNPDSKYNRRYDANTLFTLTGPVASKTKQVTGTLANCSGGKTPWNTVLSCEENYHYFDSKYGWKNFNRKDYGWVVEIDPFDPEKTPVKHTALGRFSHENAAVAQAKSGETVVYMGDDKADEHIYKFISKAKSIESKSKVLEEGALYVAKLDGNGKGKWIELSMDNADLKAHFKDQADLLINTRKAAKLVTATPMNRPEDLEVSPFDSSVFVALTKNPDKGDDHGSILKLTEADHSDLEFRYENFLVGGELAGISCPDNLCFDNQQNLWVCTDISGDKIGKKRYAYHGNNSLFVVPTKGIHAGQPIRMASAPKGAELTGPYFSDDYQTLFLSVQHPGEDTKSDWNEKNGQARSAVVAISMVGMEANL